ncbi:hypothetical protein SAMN04488540_104132 [Ferrimonas sediminum]|uniref:Uncharacterized protein n=1 Tax=Ferrimonas sediminum TaxID=718193 RepID=A0A1G8PZ16_9GAMM|nr:hypothetical protein [Ferrimonas sediminum]SDI97628.1 hypothetical protein SAMN04488540_104132 [Ferrimonas sediminum]
MTEWTSEVLKLRQWVHVAHHIPGRIRLKFNSTLITQMARFKAEKAMEQATQFPPLKRYQLNTSSNSLILEYDHGVIQPDLLDQLFSPCEQQASNACTTLITTLTPIYQAGVNHNE